MIVQVRLFALAKELAQTEFVEIELSDEADVTQLKGALAASLPALASVLRLSMVAVDAQYASDDTKLHAGAEIALIPPVSGG